ncbi:MAG TPA: hypothetical protein VNP04_30365, partial [Alphaproteobacteria bacterium]|nr:hypothetical protein [Alphaproteobacteria bacterium]
MSARRAGRESQASPLHQSLLGRSYSNLFGPWGMGAALFTFDGRGRFDARQTLDLLERYPISWRPRFSSSHTADALP